MAVSSELPWEYILSKYLLLLATVVATVTYTAGFTPPGGVWQEKDSAGGYLAGEPVIRHTSYPRFVAFFYLNAVAFASSLVVIVLILILAVRHEQTKSGNTNKWLGPVGVLRGFMVLDLLSLIGAYTAGIYRDRDVPVYTMVLAALTIVYLIVFHMVLPPKQQQHEEKLRREHEKLRKVLMLLATFAVSVTYMAGLNVPGGFWNSAKDGHQPGEPILMGGSHEKRLKAFVHLNSTAFFFSLLITVQLLDTNLSIHDKKVQFRFHLLCASIILALLGLVGAYAAGSCKETDTTIYVTLLGAALPACIIIMQLIMTQLYPRKKGDNNNSSCGQQTAHDEATTGDDRQTNDNNSSNDDKGDGDKEKEKDKEARSLVLLLATLAATITYQAGLDPPGGLWENDGKDYRAGDPILQTTNHRRYNAFFYCNSVAFMASLVAIILVNKESTFLRRTHALQVAMILDLFGLIGAYAAGSCRDVSTSIYAMALAGAVLVYVVIHIVFFTLDHDTTSGTNDELLEKRRKRLQLFAILVATITYQAGLTPPGGFYNGGDHTGDPVLLYNSPQRYKAFFYCNSVSFMLSISMILLLVNKNLYKPAIQSNAISVCTAAGMFSVVGAYAAGSTQHMRTSIKIFGLVASILIFLVLAILFFVNRFKGKNDHHVTNENTRALETQGDEEAQDTKEQQRKYWEEKKLHSESKYLMLLGILAASVTYQAGLKPPGGVWQDGTGHVAGNPVMHDNGRTRYMAFFYINSTSFVASIIVIILLLLKLLLKNRCKDMLWLSWSLSPMNITIVLDLLALLVAYAVGSTRSLKATGYVFMLIFIVLTYIIIHATLTHFIRYGFSSLKEIILNCFRRENADPAAPDPESHEEQVL